MTLLQVKIDDKLKKAIDKKADTYGVSVTALVRITLVKSFMSEMGHQEDFGHGNIFNADRDNNGKGIKIDDLINAL